MKRLKEFVPILGWLPHYNKGLLQHDLLAGLTVGVMLIPQGMAYAIIAGLPPVYGLYAALVPQVVYAILGTSRQLSVGPVAMDSLLVAAGLAAMHVTSPEMYISLAILLAFLMGGIQFLLGVARLGFLVNFLSKPVISGFTSAAAIIIGMNQLKHLFGVEIGRSNQVHELLFNVLEAATRIHPITFVIGVAGIVVIYIVKKINAALPAALIVVVLGILLVQMGGLNEMGVQIVGEIPDGLPAFKWPIFSFELANELMPIAITLALVAFMEAIAVSKAVQEKHKNYEVDANQELIALGASNILGSFFGTYPVTGGFSRTAVNDKAGAKTGVSALVAAVLIGLTLLFLTPLFYYLPKAVLASVIIVAVAGLIDYKYPIYLWKLKKEDFIMLLFTFVVTLTVGIKEGIITGVLVSIATLVFRSTRPHYAVLGKLKGTDIYRNVKRFKEVEEIPGVLILRYDAQLYFANINHFKQSLKAEIKKKTEQLHLVILDFESVNGMDTSAIYGLQDIIQELKSEQINVALADVKGPVRDLLKKSGIVQELGENNFFLQVANAVGRYEDKLTATGNKFAVQSND